MADGININGFLKSLDRISKQREAVIARGVKKFAEDVIGRAMKLCPIGETKNLVNSGIVGDIVISSADISVTIGFNTEYAAAVHEILDNYHPIGQAKFLETAMREMAPDFMDYIKDELEEEFG